MRIRRNASKFLGSTSIYANPWPPPPPPAPAPPPPATDVTGLVCELNCSPWDVMLIDNLPNSSCCSSSSCSLTNPKGEDEGGGIFGNSIKTEEEEPISAIISTAAELTFKAIMQTDVKKVKKLERKKSKDNKEKAAAADATITYCKKNDGKGWHCKRPAQLPHSFCSYHLAQTRSYSSNHRATDHASESTAAETRAEAGDSNNLYYYYGGFGPWRGKRRGRAVTISARVKEEEKEDGRKSVDLDGDDHNVVAGDDEYDLDCFGEDEAEDEDDDDNDSYGMPRQDHQEGNGKKRDGEELMKKWVIKKRGRKPLKSRSLKSLL